ncbi:multicopper oxidase family protein [Geobacter argillaceus]|uniref:FtsP/CotA-like multicopper oxidase with cupredoxin domain n=1 Tax=Geobacter argillaceus TaxID=345631 RepID=A0A562VKT0_9BACT|nr:multicopper oxidase domain-containing protein [Geobacter argillaceus]TWJ18401.1 FtsP/CotA-like multicopper oxidase with cupredoxin domain [Geobacter argillaceus]
MKKISRRKFLQISGLAAGASMLPLPVKWLGRNDAFAFYQSPANKIPLFKTTLRGVGPGQIPVAASDGVTATGAAHYSIDIKQFQDSGVCPTLGPTSLWGYNPVTPLGGGSQPQKHLGGIIVAKKGSPVQITFTNRLPANPIIPVDKSNYFPDAQISVNRTSTHLHGGFVPWISDGGPMAFFDPNGNYGPSIASGSTNFYKILNPGLLSGQGEVYYPNQQSARLMWYHDHAHDITRTNAYAGIATAYVLRDDFEGNLRNMGLPPFIEDSVLGGKLVQELPLIFQDKIFVGANINTFDPTWKSIVDPSATTPGSLWYPHLYERNRWRRSTGLTPPNPSCIPEMFGDTMLVNGTVFPETTVEARRYRLRILNACQARFMNLQLYVDDGSPDGITLETNPLSPNFGNPTNAPFVDAAQNQPAVLQIGAEGGFLPKPALVPTNAPFAVNPVTGLAMGSLFLAPAERADLILDFGKYSGKNIILYSDAPAPFPMGDPRNDYFPKWNTTANPVNGLTTPGFGPNTRILMRFKVVAATGSDLPLTITKDTDLSLGIDPFLTPPGGTPRRLTLNENFDAWGRLQQRLGTDALAVRGAGMAYMDPSTENPAAGTTEVWEIYNLTGDTHPIHLHLVNFQILNRQPFDAAQYMAGTTVFTGPAIPPDPNESGWKETARMHPGTVTRILMRFDLPTTPFAVPNSLNPMLGTPGKEYVWHCHILEHEEHDMMRPMVIT